MSIRISLVNLTLVIISFSSACGRIAAQSDGIFVPIDLRGHCNMGFKDGEAGDERGGWMDQGAKDLRDFPTGKQTFCDIDFDIIDPDENNGKSCIVLKGKNRPYFPQSVKGIPVNRKLASLYILHSGAWLHPTGWAPAYKYIINYEDGSSAGKTVGVEQVSDWGMPRDLADATIAWTGTTTTGEQVGVWMMAWPNPNPDKLIKSIDIISNGLEGPLGIIAITGATQTVKPVAAVQKKRTVEGLLGLERRWFYRGQKICGTLRLKNFTERPINGRAVISISAGDTLKIQKIMQLRFDKIEAAETVELSLDIDNLLDIGLYDVSAVFEYDKQAHKTIELDATQIVCMGGPPASPLTSANFTIYSEPLFLMIGYVKSDAELMHDFSDMKNRGFDIVCLEWFWQWLEPQRGQYDMARLTHVIDMAKQAGLKYWMYVGFWQLNPDWTARISGPDGKPGAFCNFWNKDTRASLLALYEQIAQTCRNNDTVIGYTIRLFPPGWADRSDETKIAWREYLVGQGYNTREKLIELYGNAPAGNVLDERGKAILPDFSFSQSSRYAKVWHLYLNFQKSALTSVMDEVCQAIRRHDKVKPIRLNLAQSYEPENEECAGWDAIAVYRMAEKYGCVVNQECFEFPYHASKEPPLVEKYGLALTTEGGAVPIGPAGSAALMAHVIETNVAYVAYCHYDVHSDSFQWLQYKPFWKIRKAYKRVYDNLTVTSFWQDSWVGKQLWPRFWQYHFMFNLALIGSSYEYDMINEDLLAKGNFNKNSVLLDTNSFYIEDEVCKNIADFIRNGGTFVGDHLSGINTYDKGEEYSLYRKYLGINIVNTNTRGSVTFGKLVLTNQPGFAITPQKTDVVLARWSDGRVAAIERKIGKGRAFVFGFPVQAAMDEILALAGVKRQLVTNATEGGIAKNDKGEYFITLLNSRVVAVPVSVRQNGLIPNAKYTITNLVSQKSWTENSDATGSLVFDVQIPGTKCCFLTVTRASEN